MKRGPWIKWYWSDWRSDPALRMCSIAARGLWAEMLALMQEGSPYGHLLIAGRAPTDAQLGVLAGVPADQLPDLIGELEAAGVFSRTRANVIYSRRMVRDEKKSRTAQKNGERGGNPNLCNETQNSSSVNPTVNPEDKPQIPEAREQKEKDISLESNFAGWYAAYPRHVGRGQAEKAYRAALRKADAGILLAAAQRFAALCRGKDPTFIPHPATWLNGERWLDDAAPTLALVEPGPRNPSTFTLDDWIVRVRMAQDDPSKWLPAWGELPASDVAPVAAAPRYLELHRKRVSA